jgi:ribonuclease-3
MVDVTGLERNLGLVFIDKSLLHRALVHRSYLNEHPSFPLEDNERLEFLGDAVLGFFAGEYLYHRCPELAEGPLTSLRSVLVRRETLALFAAQLDLGRHLQMGTGESAGGGRERPAVLCATFEALVGAIYLDQGLETVQRFLSPLIAPVAARTLEEQSDKDYKSRLQELAQSHLRHTPRYTTVTADGPDHAKRFTVEVSIGGEPYGQGTGRNKQQAAQQAAQAALDRLAAESASAGQDAGNAVSLPAEHQL